MTDLVYCNDVDRVRVIYLNHPNIHNPFNKSLENAVIQALETADHDDSINAIVVYGGKGRSFGAGGDFNEVKLLSGGDDVDQWIDRVINLYLAVLNVKKPSVACIEGFGIGMSFQFSMMFDWRIMTDNATLVMPELKHGIGCSIGAAILQKVSGYNNMKEIIYGCENIAAEKALAYQLINEIYSPEYVLDKAIMAAKKFAHYPIVSFVNTKKAINKAMIDLLLQTAEDAKRTHRACFAEKSAQHHFSNILGEKY